MVVLSVSVRFILCNTDYIIYIIPKVCETIVGLEDVEEERRFCFVSDKEHSVFSSTFFQNNYKTNFSKTLVLKDLKYEVKMVEVDQMGVVRAG